MNNIRMIWQEITIAAALVVIGIAIGLGIQYERQSCEPRECFGFDHGTLKVEQIEVCR